MELKTATHLIEKAIPATGIQAWADLGAGGGLFTRALSQLLPKGSSITAIDKKASKIEVAAGINLIVKTGDFVTMKLDDVDGILMANALHYVKDQKDFLNSLKKITKRIVLVEYNMDNANTWVPYPISFNTLRSMADAKLLAEAPSQYQPRGIYSALISF
ncbi:MAG: methyltransferase domain-containing protein [Bacteroidota bacterium]